jgi:putative hemolysin
MKKMGILLIAFLLLFGCTEFLTSAPKEGQIRQIIVWQTGGAAALIQECGDKNYINNTADYIIEGTVGKVESKWEEETHGPPTLILTYTNLSIEKYIKGTPFAQNELLIVTQGGTVGEVSQGVEDQPIFHEGKKVRIYFAQGPIASTTQFTIVCGHLGVEDITEGTGGTQLANPASVYCIEKNGTLEIRESKAGQRGVCIFQDGSECEEWAFFREECQRGVNFCKDLCGDGICQKTVCEAIGCPCPETLESCPDDCTEV